MAITGVNPDEVRAAIVLVKSAYGDILKALVTDSQNSFINPMSSLWGSPDAVDFFKNYGDVISSLKSSVITTFTSVIESMNSAGKNMTSLGGSTWADVVNDVDTSAVLDISVIKDNLDGVIGVDVTSASSTADSAMSTIESKINQELSLACRAVNTSGFVGDDMQENLVSSLNKIQDAVSSAFSTLKTSIKAAIENTETAYKTTSGNISNAFSGSNSGGGPSKGLASNTVSLKN